MGAPSTAVSKARRNGQDPSGGCAQKGVAEGKKRRKEGGPSASDLMSMTQEHGVHKGSGVLVGDLDTLQGLGVEGGASCHETRCSPYHSCFFQSL